MTSTEERLEALEARVRHLEDIIAIQRLVAQYGPSVDSNSIELAGQIWSADGVYTVHPGMDGPESTDVLDGRDQVEEMLYGPFHQAQVEGGCAHIMSAPLITVDGDRAIAICYLTLVNRRPDGFVVARQSANRWELERGAEGWKVKHRATSLLDGRTSTVRLVHDALAEVDATGALFGTGRVTPS